MVDSVGNIAITVGANVADFIVDMGKAGNSVDGFGKKTRALMNTMAQYGAAAAAAGAAVVAGLYVSGAQAIDQQAKLAQTLDGTIGGLRATEMAAGDAGVATEKLYAAASRMNTALGQATGQSGAAYDALTRLGLSAESLIRMDIDDRFAAIADKMKAMNLSGAQAQDIMRDLGVRNENLANLMRQGGDAFREQAEEVKALGLNLSMIDAAKVEMANNAIGVFGDVLTAVQDRLTVTAAPYITVLADNFRNAAVQSGGFKKQVDAAIENIITGFGQAADFIQGLRVAFKGVELVAVGFGATVFSVFEGFASVISETLDKFTVGINLAIAASNALLGTSYEFLSLPSESNFMKGLHEAADKARNKVGEIRTELGRLAMQTMPSDSVAKYLADVERKAEEDARKFVGGRKKKFTVPEENDVTKKKRETADNILDGLRSGTEGMRAELQKRGEIVAIYRNNQLAADASYYAQQLNDIKITEQIKQAEIIAAAQREDAQRAEREAQNLERVAGDKAATAAIIAEYDLQEVLAEKIKQDQLTQVQQDAQLAREKLREAERQNAINVALGLGQQLMSLAQGQSKRAFEFAKASATASAIIDGYRSAVAAWSAGMSTGGPWAPFVAAAYTASSLLKTGALISNIRNTSFGSSGTASAGGGGASDVSGVGSGVAGGQAAAGANAGAVMHVQGLNPNDLFTGSAMQTIATGLLNFQKDGGKVVFDA